MFRLFFFLVKTLIYNYHQFQLLIVSAAGLQQCTMAEMTPK